MVYYTASPGQNIFNFSAPGYIWRIRFLHLNTAQNIEFNLDNFYLEDLTVDSFLKAEADIISATDYSPFGAPLPGRSYNSSEYSFEFNGQIKDNEIYGTGNSNSVEFWQYDTSLGRRWNLAPKPHIRLSDYSCLGNNPIVNIDHNGDYFFGLIGSTIEQRAEAKSFAKQNGGTIENYHSKNICVKYSSVVGLYDAEVGKDVATVIANTAHFHIDGIVSKKEVKSSYSFEFSLDVNLSVGPQIGIEAEAFGRTAGYEVNVASIDLLSLKSEIHNMEGITILAKTENALLNKG